MSWVQSRFTDFVQPPNKRQKISKQLTLAEPKDEGTATVRRWKPKKKSDLVVNKKKVEEVESWLKCVRKGETSCVTLLIGPPGCGKITVLKVLCWDLGINLIEWNPQLSKCRFGAENSVPFESEVSQFENFVSRATRYPNVLNSQSVRLIVVKDIPNCYLRDSSEFHKFLEKSLHLENVYIAFLMTDINITRELFNDTIKIRLGIKTISFNPITQKCVTTALQKIYGGKFSEYIENVSLTCNGDLRSAINTLEFLSAGNKPTVLNNKSKTQLTENKKTEVLDLFQGIGRVLYAKRADKELVYSPIQVGEYFVSSPDLFLGMLQENYLNTFSSIHDVAKAANCISISNKLFCDYKDTDVSRKLSLIVAPFGLMVHNSAPIKKFQHFNKPGKIRDCLMTLRERIYTNRGSLCDLAYFGRQIPSFAKENSVLLASFQSLK